MGACGEVVEPKFRCAVDVWSGHEVDACFGDGEVGSIERVCELLLGAAAYGHLPDGSVVGFLGEIEGGAVLGFNRHCSLAVGYLDERAALDGYLPKLVSAALVCGQVQRAAVARPGCAEAVEVAVSPLSYLSAIGAHRVDLEVSGGTGVEGDGLAVRGPPAGIR